MNWVLDLADPVNDVVDAGVVVVARTRTETPSFAAALLHLLSRFRFPFMERTGWVFFSKNQLRLQLQLRLYLQLQLKLHLQLQLQLKLYPTCNSVYSCSC